MRRSIEGSVCRRAAFFPNGWLKVRRSIDGGVYQRVAFIRGNMVIFYLVDVSNSKSMVVTS